MVFKVPKSVSGLRAPATAGVKRAVGNGLARPSSGYYSLSMKQAGEVETPEVSSVLEVIKIGKTSITRYIKY